MPISPRILPILRAAKPSSAARRRRPLPAFAMTVNGHRLDGSTLPGELPASAETVDRLTAIFDAIEAEIDALPAVTASKAG